MGKFDFVITLKHEENRFFNYVNQLLLFLSVVVFCYSAFVYKDASIFYFIMAGAVTAYWVYLVYVSRKKEVDVLYRSILLFAAVGWFHREYGNGWIGALIILIAFLEKQVKFPREIGVNSEGITFNTLPQKKYNWSSLSNAVLKDGLITIDYRNNKLFQKQVEDDVEPGIEKEFNQFCQQQLSISSSLSNVSS